MGSEENNDQREGESAASLSGCYAKRPMKRRSVVIRRVLRLIDMLATKRKPMSTKDIKRLFYETYGEEFSERTFYRDLVAMYETGLADRFSVKRGQFTAHDWKLRLEFSESHQSAAIAMITAERYQSPGPPRVIFNFKTT